MDSDDSSSDKNAPSGYETSSSTAKDSSSDPSSESNVPSVVPSDPSSDSTVTSDPLPASNVPSRGEPSSSAPLTSSDPSAEAYIPYAQQLERRSLSSGGSSEDERGPSGLTSDELIFKALETIYEDGTGLDFDDIYNFIEDRFDVVDDFREQLEAQLEALVAEGQVQKVGDRYRIRPVDFDIPTPPPARNAEEATSAKPLNTTSPSTSATSVPKPPEENPQIDAAVKEVAEAEQLERQAKEAQDLAYKHEQVLKFESQLNLQLAEEILNRCANGQKVFLRKKD
ncbi:PREDICTED: telomere repeat-binding factor 5-like [Camelina sativa]|uniref:Telomere repeat-binding factor 5-like n=1 Tax=Camelina sativa TaxID=90675 RepID=A0ABM0X5T6_CAMSA|nr:PREDICTED: telomere repeat-binding factor 5-like [Camelina sativa]